MRLRISFWSVYFFIFVFIYLFIYLYIFIYIYIYIFTYFHLTTRSLIWNLPTRPPQNLRLSKGIWRRFLSCSCSHGARMGPLRKLSWCSMQTTLASPSPWNISKQIGYRPSLTWFISMSVSLIIWKFRNLPLPAVNSDSNHWQPRG